MKLAFGFAGFSASLLIISYVLALGASTGADFVGFWYAIISTITGFAGVTVAIFTFLTFMEEYDG